MNEPEPRVTFDMWCRLMSIRAKLFDAQDRIDEIDRKYGLGDDESSPPSTPKQGEGE